MQSNNNDLYVTYLNTITSNLPSPTEIITNIKEITQCGICYEQYDTSSNKPLLLPCGHTLCKACITSLLLQTHYVPKCPFDNKTLRIQNINKYPINYGYISLIEYISNIKNKPSPINNNSFLYDDGLYEGELSYSHTNRSHPFRHGYGQMTYKNGSIYIGYWYNDKRQGKGTLTSNDKIYEGEWLLDYPHGNGKCIYKQGNISSYEGGWQYGKCFGYGKITYNDHTEIEAVFLGDNTISEIIKKRNADGSLFYGKVIDNEIPEKAYEISHDGNIYYGYFKLENNILIKDGKDCLCYLHNGNKYIGNFDNGISKEGKIIFPNGESYEGEVNEFKRNGKGVHRYNDGYVYEGMFVDDMRNGEGKLVKGNYCYEGMWKNDKKEGNGFEMMENGDKYCGEYRNGMKEGNGVYLYKNGDSYKGEWKCDKMDGKGIIVTNEGHEIKGMFSKGVIVKKGEENGRYRNECIII